MESPYPAIQVPSTDKYRAIFSGGILRYPTQKLIIMIKFQ